MESKIIYAKTKAAFQRELPNIPDNLNPLVFIEDTREVWILGHYFSIGSPGVFVTEENNIINVEIGQSNFTMSASGDNIVIRKGLGNDIIFSSPALTSITTEYPLRWDSVAKKLIHENTNITPGSYGETSSHDNASLITIPWFIVNSWGHISDVTNRNIKIRDYVEQISNAALTGNYNLLIGYSDNELTETNTTRKAIGVTYNADTHGLEVDGGINAGGDSSISGNLVVTNGNIIGTIEGDITGTATPKIHLSEEPEYGGASLNLYGHVKLQDELNGVPAPSSNNADINSASVVNGVAASPYMVYAVKNELIGIIDNKTVNGIKVNNDIIGIPAIPDNLQIRTENGLRGRIDATTGELVFSSVSIKGYNQDNQLTDITDNLRFTDDFLVDNNDLSIRWKYID